MVNFCHINRAALPVLPLLLERWVPGGRKVGQEYVVRNPTRGDKSPGSFRINLVSGRWADFATGDAGGDVIALAAYLHDLSQLEAATHLADMLGIASQEIGS
jgi:hypothetical protein